MFSNLLTFGLSTVGSYNPQLMRELQGKLRWRNLLFTSLLSFAVQGFLLLRPLTDLPFRGFSRDFQGPYCLELAKGEACARDSFGQYLVDWPLVWADVFRSLSYVLVWALVVVGVYLLAADLNKEARRSTLNFLRMSPLSGSRLLFGKLVGVPILLYLGLALMLPTHVLAGLSSGCSWLRLVGFYGLLGAIAFCFYSAAMWFSLLANGLYGLQTWLISAVSGGLLLLSIVDEHYDFATDWFHLLNPISLMAYVDVQSLGWQTPKLFDLGRHILSFDQFGWFFLWLGGHGIGFWCFAMANAGLLGWWFWQALLRKFQSPTLTSLSKVQSYGLTLHLAVLMMGFEFQRLPKRESGVISAGYTGDDFFGYLITMGLWIVLLLFLLIPAKQSVLDWARYHYRLRGRSSQRGGRLSDGRRVRHDWRRWWNASYLKHEGGPYPLAIGVNLAIMTSVLLIGFAVKFWVVRSYDPAVSVRLYAFGCWLFGVALYLLCAFLLQFIALSNFHHWRWLAIGTVGTVLFGWPIVLLTLGVGHYNQSWSFIWMTTMFPAIETLNGFEMLTSFVFHMSVLVGLHWGLKRRIQFLGQSEWKALMSPSALVS